MPVVLSVTRVVLIGLMVIGDSHYSVTCDVGSSPIHDVGFSIIGQAHRWLPSFLHIISSPQKTKAFAIMSSLCSVV